VEEEKEIRTQREDLLVTQEGGHLQAKERGLRRTNTADTLILGTWPPEI
jgi:hypothetical protein